MQALAAPAVLLAPLLLARGHRIHVNVALDGASRRKLQSADIEKKCPLSSDAQFPGFLFPARDEGERRMCCAGGEALFSCGPRDLQVGDEVRLAPGEDREPGPGVPLVVAATDAVPGYFRQLTVRLAESADRERIPQDVQDRGEWTYFQDKFQLYVAGSAVPPPFSCDCGICSRIRDASDIVDLYEVPLLGNTLDVSRYYVRADLVPRGFSPTYGAGTFNPAYKYVLYLYPYASGARNLAFNKILCERIACYQQQGYKVMVKYVKNSDEVKAYLEKFPPRTIKTAILGASGSQEQLAYGDASIFFSEAGGGEEFLVDQLGPKMSLDGTVVLDPHLDDTAYADDLQAGADVGRATFDFVAGRMHGRKVRAPTVAFDFRFYDSMWKIGAEEYRHGYECLDDDTAIFQRQEQPVTLEATAGRPKCAELTGAEVAEFAQEGKVCVSECAQTCRKAMKALKYKYKQVSQIKKLKLTLTDEEDDRENECSWSPRIVCEMGGIE